ncbi:unnamed protein product [Brassicogethes aeneus]|uniref:Peroxidase n=1 Tax=Brassicogethes aeneus TaxID=1431903 RepID=A0A9P0FH83_BRAAE|nr:unnamed protein product [Brassicogethes aeneus]
MGQFNLRITSIVFILVTVSDAAIVFKDSKDGPFVTEEVHKRLLEIPYKQILNSLKLTNEDLQHAVNFASGSIKKMHRMEENLHSADIGVKAGTPTKGIYIVNSPNNISISRAKDALIVNKATGYLISANRFKHNLPSNSWSQIFSGVDFKSLPIGESCNQINKFCNWKKRISPYRTSDGSCNNDKHGSRGESNTVYKRTLPADYLDGVSQFRRSVTKKQLPSARTISNFLIKNKNETAYDLTAVVGQWWQFIEQDLSQTAASVAVSTGKEIECCDEGYKLSPRYEHSFCAPIQISEDDSFYSQQYLNCMPYIRSLPGLRHECTFGPREQVNQATHYLDGSQIYGSTEDHLNNLRSFKNGKLKGFMYNNTEFLQLSKEPINDCQFNSNDEKCFISGDSRVNFHPYMTVLHLLWHREHNRIAEELSKINPDWDDETLFQETRRIVVAQMQHITYDEYLPIILGKKKSEQIANDNDYNKDIDPRVSNSFATAALRSLNSLVDDNVILYDEERKAESVLDLENHFNKPEVILQKNMFDKLLRSLSTQLCQKQDDNYANDIKNQLYFNGVFGLDVLSLDIQRGRDHGLRSYFHYKNLCRPKDKKYENFEDVMTQKASNSIKNIYAHSNDVDLIVGGLLEKPDEDAQIGPTFSCIISDQMYRTKVGDKYFYKNRNQPKPFTPKKVKEIEKTSLARVICDNSDNIQMMQPNAFKHISQKNNLINCNDLPKMDLLKWIV